MKNILNEQPKTTLDGRLKFSVNFVKDSDIKDKIILDIGCGFGWCEINFIERGCKKIVGIELSDEDLVSAKKYVKDANVRFEVGSAIKLPFPSASFDTVVSWEVLEHIPKSTEVEMFTEIARVLRPGGVFYMSTPHRHLLSNLLDPAWWLIGHRHYTREQLRVYGQNSGLVLETTCIKGRIWSLLSLLNMYISKWLLHRPQLFRDYFLEKDDMEYNSTVSGFANIFAKFRKI